MTTASLLWTSCSLTHRKGTSPKSVMFTILTSLTLETLTSEIQMQMELWAGVWIMRLGWTLVCSTLTSTEKTGASADGILLTKAFLDSGDTLDKLKNRYATLLKLIFTPNRLTSLLWSWLRPWTRSLEERELLLCLNKGRTMVKLTSLCSLSSASAFYCAIQLPLEKPWTLDLWLVLTSPSQAWYTSLLCSSMMKSERYLLGKAWLLTPRLER